MNVPGAAVAATEAAAAAAAASFCFLLSIATSSCKQGGTHNKNQQMTQLQTTYRDQGSPGI
jgi:hypothetical protein